MSIRITSIENEYPEPESEWWFWKFYPDDKPQGFCCAYGYQKPNSPNFLRYFKRINVDGFYNEHPEFETCSYDDDLLSLTNNTDNPLFQTWFNGLNEYDQELLKQILPF